MAKRRDSQPGDVFELKTPKGFACVQYVCTDSMMGDLIRALYPIHESRPDSLSAA